MGDFTIGVGLVLIVAAFVCAILGIWLVIPIIVGGKLFATLLVVGILSILIGTVMDA